MLVLVWEEGSFGDWSLRITPPPFFFRFFFFCVQTFFDHHSFVSVCAGGTLSWSYVCFPFSFAVSFLPSFGRQVFLEEYFFFLDFLSPLYQASLGFTARPILPIVSPPSFPLGFSFLGVPAALRSPSRNGNLVPATHHTASEARQTSRNLIPFHCCLYLTIKTSGRTFFSLSILS